MYKLTDASAGYSIIQAASTMHRVLGFENGIIDLSVQYTVGSTLKSTLPRVVGLAV